jgi:multidrug efflux system membrane fusion protein
VNAERPTPRLALLVVLPIAASAGCHRTTKPAERAPVPVRAETAQVGGVLAGARFSANIQPRQQVTLSFKSGGYVREILKLRGSDGSPRNVQQGDRVAKGTVLSRVRETDYVEKVNQAKASLAEAEAALQRQRLDFKRSQALFDSKSLTRADFDAASAQLDEAKARADSARAQLDSAKIALEDCALVAPMAALVLARSVEEGALVGSGSPGFVLADTTSVKAVFGVPDVVRNLKIGQPVPVSIEAVPGKRFTGHISAIAPSADQTSRVFDVELTIPNPDGELRSGMIAVVEAPREGVRPPDGKASGAAVPLTAIVKSPSDAEGYAVYVLEGDAARPVAKLREVKLGEITGNRIAVISGLAAGERVVVTGTTIVANGDVVRVIP